MEMGSNSDVRRVNVSEPPAVQVKNNNLQVLRSLLSLGSTNEKISFVTEEPKKDQMCLMVITELFYFDSMFEQCFRSQLYLRDSCDSVNPQFEEIAFTSLDKCKGAHGIVDVIPPAPVVPVDPIIIDPGQNVCMAFSEEWSYDFLADTCQKVGHIPCDSETRPKGYSSEEQCEESGSDDFFLRLEDQ